MNLLQMDEKTRSDILNTCDEKGYIAAASRFAEEYESSGHVLPFEIAQVYTIAKKPSKALDWMEKGYEDHDANIPYIGLNMFLKGPIKLNDIRFIELLKKLNLPLTDSE